MQNKEDFLGTEPIGKLLFRLSIPTVVAQLINMLYNIVDRIYIGHIPGEGSLALTGVGVCMPIIMIVSAVAALVSSGGAPRASIFMGKKVRTADPWHECFHYCPGIYHHFHGLRPDRCSLQHHSGSGVYLRIPYGRTGSCPCNGSLPGDFLRVGHPLSLRQENPAPYPYQSFTAGSCNHSALYFPWSCCLYYAGK